MKQIIECVPNFSEGRDKGVIDAIVAEIVKGGEVKLLDVDPGEATNRHLLANRNPCLMQLSVELRKRQS